MSPEDLVVVAVCRGRNGFGAGAVERVGDTDEVRWVRGAWRDVGLELEGRRGALGCAPVALREVEAGRGRRLIEWSRSCDEAVPGRPVGRQPVGAVHRQ